MTMLTWTEAGRQLADRLRATIDHEPVVVAVSPSGATIASEVAHALAAPLDILTTVRLVVPGRAHSIYGAVTDSGEVTLLPERIAALGLPSEYVDRMIEVARRDALERSEGWRGSSPAIDVWGRTVILVDDGRSDTVAITTAASVLRQAGAGDVIFAAPTATADLIRALSPVCPHQVLLQSHADLLTTLVCGPAFPQLTPTDVRALVRRSRPNLTTAAGC